MFTNKGKPPENAVALPDPALRRQMGGRAQIASIIASGVKIIGAIEAMDAELQIDGEVEGNVRGGAVTIGETGLVKGDIASESVTVHGQIEGSVRSRKVQLMRNAHVKGDIIHQSLSIEMGAVFEGQCRYLQDPLRQEGPGTPAQPQMVDPRGSDSYSGFGEPSDNSDGRMVQGVIVTGASN